MPTDTDTQNEDARWAAARVRLGSEPGARIPRR